MFDLNSKKKIAFLGTKLFRIVKGFIKLKKQKKKHQFDKIKIDVFSINISK